MTNTATLTRIDHSTQRVSQARGEHDQIGSSLHASRNGVVPAPDSGDVATAGGFTRFRSAAETPFNRVLEARP